jgi:hypothetical protein
MTGTSGETTRVRPSDLREENMKKTIESDSMAREIRIAKLADRTANNVLTGRTPRSALVRVASALIRAERRAWRWGRQDPPTVAEARRRATALLLESPAPGWGGVAVQLAAELGDQEMAAVVAAIHVEARFERAS